MRRLLLVCLGCAWAIVGSSEGDVRQVDFANHDYLWREADSWPDVLQWLPTSESNRVRLVNGRWELSDSDPAAADDSKMPFAGLTLDEVVYGDLTGDSKDEAVAVVRFDSGGTQYYYWVYIYSGPATRPKLPAYFRAGDRAAQGLYRVYVRDQRLVVEVYDPDEQQGDCCSSGFIRRRYRWNGNAFAVLGATEKGSPGSVSRRRVSTFGMPYDQMSR